MQAFTNWPETVFAGSLYLLALAFFVLRLLNLENVNLLKAVEQVPNLSTGGAGVIIAVVLIISFFLGTLSARLLGDLFGLVDYLWKKVKRPRGRGDSQPEKTTREVALDALVFVSHSAPASVASAYNNLMTYKTYFRSLMFALPILMLTSWPWGCGSSEPEISRTSRILFGIFELLFVLAFYTQWKAVNEFRKKSSIVKSTRA